MKIRGRRRAHSRARLWLVGALVAVFAGMPMLHCITGGAHGAPSAQHHHSALLTVSGFTAVNPAAVAAHPHAGSALHAAWCTVFDVPTAATRGDNPLRLLVAVVVAVLAAAVTALPNAFGSRSPPPPRAHPGPGSGRDILTTFCVIRR
ncbi:hypothetical protein R2362_15230 [Mycobacteroides chelonae]|nr:hypothetical protein [Mycobacteroides chelonae]